MTSQGALAVPAGARFRGVLAFRGRVRVEGRLDGEVVAEGALEIGESAVVRARVQVDELVVAGRLVGDASARRRIELLPGAHVEGDLLAPTLVVADGCRVDGRLETGDPAPQGPPPALSSP